MYVVGQLGFTEYARVISRLKIKRQIVGVEEVIRIVLDLVAYRSKELAELEAYATAHRQVEVSVELGESEFVETVTGTNVLI